MISEDFRNTLERELSIFENTALKIVGLNTVYGGSINDSYCLKTTLKKYFVKINSSVDYPQMFEKEMQALEFLRSMKSLNVPKPFLNGKLKSHAFLIMEYVEATEPNADFWQKFGRGLAQLHRNTNEKGFGFDADNYVGSLQQKNEWKRNWVEFFIENRMQFQVKLAFDAQLIDSSFVEMLEKLYAKLETIFPEEPSALLHGDLWSGNFMVDSKGNAAVMDPAIYFGHREMDIAMTHLFGGFDPQFYKAYHNHFPLSEGWEERIEVCNLYPLMVHVNLFGASYASRVKGILKRFV